MRRVLNKNIYPWLLSGISLLMSLFAYVVFVYELMSGELFWSLNKKWFEIMFFYFAIALAFAFAAVVIGVRQRKERHRFIVVLSILMPFLALAISIIAGFAVELSIILRST